MAATAAGASSSRLWPAPGTMRCVTQGGRTSDAASAPKRASSAPVRKHSGWRARGDRAAQVGHLRQAGDLERPGQRLRIVREARGALLGLQRGGQRALRFEQRQRLPGGDEGGEVARAQRGGALRVQRGALRRARQDRPSPTWPPISSVARAAPGRRSVAASASRRRANSRRGPRPAAARRRSPARPRRSGPARVPPGRGRAARGHHAGRGAASAASTASQAAGEPRKPCSSTRGGPPAPFGGSSEPARLRPDHAPSDSAAAPACAIAASSAARRALPPGATRASISIARSATSARASASRSAAGVSTRA